MAGGLVDLEAVVVPYDRGEAIIDLQTICRGTVHFAGANTLTGPICSLGLDATTKLNSDTAFQLYSIRTNPSQNGLSLLHYNIVLHL